MCHGFPGGSARTAKGGVGFPNAMQVGVEPYVARPELNQCAYLSPVKREEVSYVFRSREFISRERLEEAVRAGGGLPEPDGSLLKCFTIRAIC